MSTPEPVAPTTPLVRTFMTHRMSDEAILLVNTGRDKETELLEHAVKRSLQAAPGALQHVVIYGPRGFGKSFVTRLMQIKVRDLATPEAPIPFVLLPEEQHNLTRSPHALPDYIAHRLHDLRTGEDRSWAGAMFQWPDPKAQSRLWNDAVARLEAELDLTLAQGKGMAVVAIENFDTLLFSVFKEPAAEQRLRKWLDRPNNRLMLLATATGSVDMDYERPLFQAFQPIRLEPWTPETCLDYFNRRRAAENKPPLGSDTLPKARAVADFIGGNPRLAQLLAEVLDTHDALSVTAVMDALADKLADYYRRRIDDLPPLAQGLLDALIRGGEPASQTELARRVGADSQATIARTMQELQRADVLRGIAAPDSRETLYRVSDRVFVHFYRVRQGQQLALRTPLATILDFLEAYYSREEKLAQALKSLDCGRTADARVFADLARQGCPVEQYGNYYLLRFRWRWLRFLRVSSEETPWPIDELLRGLGESPEDLAQAAMNWQPRSAVSKAARAILSAQALVRLGLNDAAEKKLTEELAINLNSRSQILIRDELAIYYFNVKKNRELTREHRRAMAAIDTADIPPTLRCVAFRAAAWIHSESHAFDKALEKYREAASVAASADDTAELAVSLGRVALLLGQSGMHQEAIATSQRAAEFAAKVGDFGERAFLLNLSAQSLYEIGMADESIVAAGEAFSAAEATYDLAVQARSLCLAAEACLFLGREKEALADALRAYQIALGGSAQRQIAISSKLALKAAVTVPSRAAVACFESWLIAIPEAATDYWTNPNDWTFDWLAAATRAQCWDLVDPVLDRHATRFKGARFFGFSTGQAIATIANDEGRASAFAAGRAALDRLKKLHVLSGKDNSRLDSWGAQFIESLGSQCHDAGLLRDIAGLMTAELSPGAPQLAAMLQALAALDEAENPQALLARTDPDLAVWLRHIRQIPESAPKPKRGKATPKARAKPTRRGKA